MYFVIAKTIYTIQICMTNHSNSWHSLFKLIVMIYYYLFDSTKPLRLAPTSTGNADTIKSITHPQI